MSDYYDIGGGAQANLAPTVSPQITDMVNNNPSASEYAKEYTHNEPAKGLLNDTSNYSKNLGTEDTGMSQAIKSRYMQDYGVKDKQLDLNIAKQAQTDKLQHLLSVSQLANQEVMQNREKALLKYRIEQANKKARGAVLGTVLGITGGIVGGVLGAMAGGVGAPGGAMAGYALGQGVGNSVGGQ